MAPATVLAFPPAAAAEHARRHAARTLVRVAMGSDEVVYRRTWPSQEAMAHLSELEFEPNPTWNAWIDSTLDLRDGLSVVEVFAPIDDLAA